MDYINLLDLIFRTCIRDNEYLEVITMQTFEGKMLVSDPLHTYSND